MLETNRLQIRLMEESDLETVRQIHNQSETIFFLSDPFHVSEEEQVQWFKRLSLSRSSRRYVIQSKDLNVICGVIRLDRIDHTNKSLEIGADVSKDYRRRGIALEAYGCILQYVFSSLGMNRVSLVTLASNVAAKSLYKRLGFKIEGKQRKAIFRNGKYEDLIMMSLLSNEFIG